MAKRDRVWVLASIAIAVLAIILLAAGISRMDFQPGILFQLDNQTEQQEQFYLNLDALLQQLNSNQNRLLWLISLAPLLLLILTLIFSPEVRKRAIHYFLRAVLWAIAFYLLFPRVLAGCSGVIGPDISSEEGLDLTGATQVSFAADTPDWLAFIVGFFLFLAITVAGWYFYQRSRRPKIPLELITIEAQNTLDEIQSGADFRNAILRCYHEMTQALAKKRGIKRQEWMTAREFEDKLVEIGLPREPVKQLTRLFERVRYGAQEPSRADERQAVACLTAIIENSEYAR